MLAIAEVGEKFEFDEVKRAESDCVFSMDGFHVHAAW